MTKAANLASLGSNASTTGILPIAGGGTAGTNGAIGFKNRIINGAMMIDQRNAGSSVSASGSFPVDRWSCYFSQASKLTMQQNAGSVTPPTGFTNYLGITSSSAYTVGSGETFIVYQKVEGYNVADLGWGASGASTVTISFWVRSSLTGTFGGSVLNSAENRSYPFSYTINVANTWEQKTVTIAGDTTGTWLKTNGSGLGLFFSMGTGSTLSGTAGSWAGTNYFSATGATSVVGTNGATFYLTGVQLEVGTTATNFDFRAYGTELALCQRYCQVFRSLGGEYDYFAGAAFYNSTSGRAWKPLLTTMRASPTVSTSGTFYIDSVSYVSLNSVNLESAEPESIRLGYTASSAGSNATGYGAFLAGSPASTQVLTVSAEL